MPVNVFTRKSSAFRCLTRVFFCLMLKSSKSYLVYIFLDAGQLYNKVLSFPFLISSFFVPYWNKVRHLHILRRPANNLLWMAMGYVGHDRVPIVGANRSFGGRQEWPSACIIPRYTTGLGHSLLRKHAQQSIVGDDGYSKVQLRVYCWRCQPLIGKRFWCIVQTIAIAVASPISIWSGQWPSMNNLVIALLGKNILFPLTIFIERQHCQSIAVDIYR